MERELLKKRFEAHGFQTVFFDTGEEAAAYLHETLQGKDIAFGGSVTVQELGLFRLLSEKNQVIWHWDVPGRETLLKAREAEIYITGVNGVSATGELVNIDGTGNRVSQMMYGPKKVYVIAGKNKICPDLAGAMDRAKNIAAPKNAARLQLKTPCVTAGRCMDCSSPDRICCATVILERPCRGMEVEVIFVDENMGY
ncbi:MAG: lactate utilization protein [Clostridium sp.]|jgi:L-lactate utilization protein LutB